MEVNATPVPAAQATNTTPSPQAEALAKAPAPETKSVGGAEAKPVATPPGQEQLYEIKINGKVHKMTLEDLKAEASLSGASRQRFEEAAKIQKTNQGLIEAFMAGDARTFEAIANAAGLSKEDAIARFEKAYKAAVIDPGMMTEEEKLRAENEQFKKEKADSEAKAKAEKEAEEQKSLDHHTRMQLQTDLIQGLESSGLPKNRFTLGRMAFYMKQNLANGYDAPMEVIVRQVKQERQAIVQQQIQDASAEQLIELFGEELIEKIRKHDIAKLTPQNGAPSELPTEAQRGPRGNQKRSMREVEQFFKAIRQAPRRRG